MNSRRRNTCPSGCANGVDEPGERVGGNDGARDETEQDARGERPQHPFGSRHEARR